MITTVSAEDRLAFRCQQNDLEEMLGNLLDNACKWADERVTLKTEALLTPSGGRMQIRLIVDDDGLGRRAFALSCARMAEDKDTRYSLGH